MSSDVKSLEYATRSCDRCNKRKKRCSMHLPTCNQCLLANVECTQLRPKRQYRETPKAKLLDKALYQQILEVNVKQVLTNYSQVGKSSRSEFFLINYHAISGNILIKTLLTTLNVTMSSTNKSDLNFLAILVEKFSQGKKMLPKILECTESGFLSDNLLYLQAVDAYFHYYGTLAPLFTTKQYFLRPRSKILKLSIYAAGLLLLIREPDQFPFLPDLFNLLLKEASKHMFKPSLDTVQALFIIRHCLLSVPQFSGIGERSRILIPFMLHQLGLNHKRPGLKSELQIEYTLTYNTSLLYLYMEMCIPRDSGISLAYFIPDCDDCICLESPELTGEVELDVKLILSYFFRIQLIRSHKYQVLRYLYNAGSLPREFVLVQNLQNDSLIPLDLDKTHRMLDRINQNKRLNRIQSELVTKAKQLIRLLTSISTVYSQDLNLYLKLYTNTDQHPSQIDPSTLLTQINGQNNLAVQTYLQSYLSLMKDYLAFGDDLSYHPFNLYPLVLAIYHVRRYRLFFNDLNTLDTTLQLGILKVQSFMQFLPTKFLATIYLQIYGLLSKFS